MMAPRTMSVDLVGGRIYIYLQVNSELEAVVDKLAKEVQKGTLPRKTFPKPAPITNSVISHNSQNSTL